MKTIKIKELFGVLLFLFFSIETQAQSFVPSPQQIEQFKNLSPEQQKLLAEQMGFDASMLSELNSNSSKKINNQPEVDFVNREIEEKDIGKELAKQSSVEDASSLLKPFGYDLFDVRDEPTQPSRNTPAPPNYTIGPGDIIKLQLFGKETGSYELEVNNEGNLDIPDLGPLNVSGLTFAELKKLVNAKYKQQKIGVSPFISMGQLGTIQIFLVGEVYRPGPLVVSGLSTVTSALLNSGGVNSIGSLRNIQLKRAGITVVTFDLYDLIVFGDTSNDVRLEQGDVLFVPTAENIVSIDGHIRRPAIYEMKEKETVSDLLGLVGGLLPNADANSIQLIRNESYNGLSIIDLSLSIESTLLKPLKNGDYIRVPEINQEFNNAIRISGAIGLPRIISDTQVFLSELITAKSLLSSTDLEYALIARKGKLQKRTEIIQFEPLAVIDGKFNMQLQAHDELIIFDRSIQNKPSEDERLLEKKQTRLLSDNVKQLEVDGPDQLETQRFTPEMFDDSDNTILSRSREELLVHIIRRLKAEADEKHPVQLLEVAGEVRHPGVYPLTNTTTINDILKAAGGLKESAHLESAEVSRMKVVGGKSIVEHMQISLIEQMLLPDDSKMKMYSKDVLNVVRVPNWYENKLIELKGEVVFPGKYQVSDGEKLSNVIARAGGLTNKATIQAAVFSREELKIKEKENIDKAVEDLRQQLASNNLSNSQFSKTVDYQSAMEVLADLNNIEPLGRMVIDLTGISRGDKASDIEVKDGDVLTIPSITPAISVIGEVFVSTTHMFSETLTIDDYIDLAGGIREYGDSSKIYIVRANGAVFTPSESFWFKSNEDSILRPGDTIVVPRVITNYDNISLWQGVTQIVYQTAIALAAIGSL